MRVLLTMTIAALMTAMTSHKTPAQADRNDDDRDIRAIVAQYAETWNRNDMHAWGTLFTDDVDYVNRAGGWWQSNADNVSAHTAMHTGMVPRNSRMTLHASVEKIAFLAPDVALVHVRTRADGAVPQPAARASGGIMTLVLLKQGDTWRIRALQNTLVTEGESIR